MSCDRKNLSVLAYANEYTQWHYRTKDASVREPGYFNDNGDMLREGDTIVINYDTDTTCPKACHLHVVSIAAPGVVVASLRQGD